MQFFLEIAAFFALCTFTFKVVTKVMREFFAANPRATESAKNWSIVFYLTVLFAAFAFYAYGIWWIG